MAIQIFLDSDSKQPHCQWSGMVVGEIQQHLKGTMLGTRASLTMPHIINALPVAYTYDMKEWNNLVLPFCPSHISIHLYFYI